MADRRWIVRGVSTPDRLRITLVSEVTVGESDAIVPEAVAGGIPWVHWTVARTAWGARRNARRRHAAMRKAGRGYPLPTAIAVTDGDY